MDDEKLLTKAGVKRRSFKRQKAHSVDTSERPPQCSCARADGMASRRPSGRREADGQGSRGRLPRPVRLEEPIPEQEQETLLEREQEQARAPPAGRGPPPRSRRAPLIRSSSQPYSRFAADNDAMEQLDHVFRAADQDNFKSLVTDDPEVKLPKRFSENDFQGHFKENQFAKPYEPLKHGKKKKKRGDAGHAPGHAPKEGDLRGQGSIPEEHELELKEPAAVAAAEDAAEVQDEEGPPEDQAATPAGAMSGLVSSQEAPVLDQRAAYVPDSDDGDSRSNRVKFEVGPDEPEEEGDSRPSSAVPDPTGRRHRRHHRQVEDPADRCAPGSERRPASRA
ncbi:uncharacterized protein LOC119089308, partial [Pollicipes pollicipes]|uniref:uncharacterized protein LOC119089308 n=1 Tax=Pollicipes pollicipes TaxID=41117 RepID=UPI00188511E8